LVILKYVIAYAMMAPPRDMLRQISEKWTEVEREGFMQDIQTAGPDFWRPVREMRLWQYLSPRERDFAETTAVTMTHQQQIGAMWRLEAAASLMWALGMVATLPRYDLPASNDLLRQVPSTDVSSFIRSAQLRDQPEIDRARNTVEFWHWRSRERQLIEQGATFPSNAKLKAAGFFTFDDVVRFSARKAAQDGTLPACIDDDFPAKGKAYRDLSPDEWSQVRSITTERHYALNWLCGHATDNLWDEVPTDT
jgi:hypothetical protein